MNLSEIAQGNYESIQGTWLNESGNTIIVSGNTMSISDLTATKNAMSAKVDGLSIDIPSLNDSATGAPKKTSGQSTDDKAKDFNPFAGQAEYDKNLKVSESVQTAGVLEFGTTLVSSGIYFGFVPENVSVIYGGQMSQMILKLEFLSMVDKTEWPLVSLIIYKGSKNEKI